MNRRAITIAPIVVGAAAGGLLALYQGQAQPRATKPTEGVERSTPRAPRAGGPSHTSSGRMALPSAVPAEAAVTARTTPSSEPVAAPAASSAISVVPAERRAPVFDPKPPATEPELMTAQLGCNRQIPEDCERAGRSLESGSAGVTDAARARGLRRIALTLYVKQCESNRVAACLRLAEMYDSGDLVQPNPKNAEALRVRAKQLCATRPGDADCRPSAP